MKTKSGLISIAALIALFGSVRVRAQGPDQHEPAALAALDTKAKVHKVFLFSRLCAFVSKNHLVPCRSNPCIAGLNKHERPDRNVKA